MSVAEAPPKPAHESAQGSGSGPARQPTHTPTRELSWAPDLSTLSPSSRQVARVRPPHRNWLLVFSMGVLALLLIAAATFVVARSLRPSAPVGAPNPLLPVGTLISTSTLGTNQLEVRTMGGQVVTISAAGKKLVTADGYSLALSSFRPGDTVSATPGEVLVNRSQSRVSLQGIVAISPDPDGDVMTVQLTPTRTVLVDIDARTRIDGQLPSVRSRMSIEQADQVRLKGILDTTLGEMTQTIAITHLAGADTTSLQ
jgi:hypothetical protein